MAATPWTPGTGTTLYVHVPFCVVKCGYCDFNSYAEHSARAHDRFLGALELELARALPAGSEPATVFIGGGTPTFLDPQRFASLLATLRRHVDLAACDEVTIEANPESLTLEKAQLAREAGVNRISIGAQSFQAERLAFLDRAHDADKTRAGVRAARGAGFTNLSLDMIFGLPGQDAAEWGTDLSLALELQPDHLSCYGLTFEPGTRLTRDRARGLVAPNEPEVDLESLQATRARLRALGFEPYEISNFAGRGGPCRHNDHYWLQGNYVGVGPGAASHEDGARHTNLKPVEAWAAALDKGEPPIGDAEELTPEQRAVEAVWLGLRRKDGVDLAAVAARTGVDAAALFERLVDQHAARGHLARIGTRIALTESGIPVADAIAATFFAA